MKDISYKDFFSTLATGKRLDILQHLKQHGTQNVSQIAVATNQEQSAVSHNLKKLLDCQCVHVETQGKSRNYSLNSETITPLLDLVDQHIEKYCQAECQHCSSSTKWLILFPGIFKLKAKE